MQLTFRLLCILTFLQLTSVSAQHNSKRGNLIEDSYFPIVHIKTGKSKIQNRERIDAAINISEKNSKVNFVKDSTVNDSNSFTQLISIEERGASSKNFPQKSYSFDTKDPTGESLTVPILNLPPGNEWILYAPYRDKSLIRNVLMYSLSRKMGRYAPRTAYVQLLINDQYQGIYILTEKISKGSARVDISEIFLSDTSEDHLTGGYILKIDKQNKGKFFRSMKETPRMAIGYIKWVFGVSDTISHPSNSSIAKYENSLDSRFVPEKSIWQRIQFHFHDPKSSELNINQKKYLNDYLYQAESSLFYRDSLSNYGDYFDVESMIDYFILSEISKNVDAYRLSTYFSKGSDSSSGKITLGPVWDFDLALGNTDYCNAGDFSGWAYQFNNYCRHDKYLVPFWWETLLNDSDFITKLNIRWKILRESELKTSTILNQIDSLKSSISAAQLSSYSILNPEKSEGEAALLFEQEIKFIKDWFINRLSWMDKNIPGNNIKSDFKMLGNSY